MNTADKKKANDWIIENYPDGNCTIMNDKKTYVEWDQLLEMMVLYAGDMDFRNKKL